MMGCFYTGRNYKRRVNLKFKLGQTGKNTPAERLQGIRADEPFECLGYIVMPKATKAELLYVESYARLMVERNGKFTLSGNDHFVCRDDTQNKEGFAVYFASIALGYAIDACNIMNIEYSLGNKKYKRG